MQVKAQVMPLLMQRIDISVASALGPEELRNQIAEIVEEIIVDLKIQLNATELKADRPAPRRRHGRPRPARAAAQGRRRDRHHGQRPAPGLRRAPRQARAHRRRFRDDPHVLHVATRIVTEVGRRIDESTPLVDARLADGSRVNIIIPPLAIDGPTISIRKFSKKEITLDVMARQGNISADMATRAEDRRPLPGSTS